MPHEFCYNPKSKCPKCEADKASAEHVRYVPPDKEVVLRRCEVCGYVRVEIPLDDARCQDKI